MLPVINRTWLSEPGRLGRHPEAERQPARRASSARSARRPAALSTGAEWDKTFRDGIGGEYKILRQRARRRLLGQQPQPIIKPRPPVALLLDQRGAAARPVSARTTSTRPHLPGRCSACNGSYPLVYTAPASTTALIEPIVGAYAAPRGGNSWRIPDEDSLNFEFRDTDLFRPDRLSGYDVLDTGQRVDYGLKLGLYDKDGGSYRALIGQSLRAQTNHFLPPGSGAEDNQSDVVGRVVLSPTSYLDLIYRFRFDHASYSSRSQEIGTSFGPFRT